MLKKVKVTITALGITSLMGAGSLFSGFAIQNVYAQDEAVNRSTELNAETSIPVDESNGFSDSVPAEVSQSDPVTDNSEGNVPADSSETEKKTEDTSFEKNTSVKESADNNTGISNSNKEKSSYNYNSTGKTDNSNSVKAKNGWGKEKGGYKYYKNGRAYTGWHKMGKAEGEKTAHYSYFGSDGIIRTGWQSMGKGTKNSFNENTAKHMSYFGSDGWVRKGLQEMGNGTKNSYDENTSKHRSYFGDNGWLCANQYVTVSGKQYYANGKGWLTDEQDIFYVDGKRFTGVYFNNTGSMVKQGEYSWPRGTTYLNGIKYTGTLYDYADSFKCYVIDSNGKRESNQTKKYYSDKWLKFIFIEGEVITIEFSTSSAILIYSNLNGVKVTLNIGGEKHSGITKGEYNWLHFYTKRTFKEGQSFSVTAEFNGRKVSLTDKVALYPWGPK